MDVNYNYLPFLDCNEEKLMDNFMEIICFNVIC